MRGTGSGRRRTKNRGNVEDEIFLDLRVLRQHGSLRPNRVTTGSMAATQASRKPFRAAYSIDLIDPAYGYLDVTTTHSDRPTIHRIYVTGERCRFGGWRWFAICPVTRARVLKLVYVDGRFMSQKAAKLSYRTQSMNRFTRLQRAQSKAKAQAFGEQGCPKPRGRNRDLLYEKYAAADEAFEREWIAAADRIVGSLSGSKTN